MGLESLGAGGVGLLVHTLMAASLERVRISEDATLYADCTGPA
jgi:hypothetical protein